MGRGDLGLPFLDTSCVVSQGLLVNCLFDGVTKRAVEKLTEGITSTAAIDWGPNYHLNGRLRFACRVGPEIMITD